MRFVKYIIGILSVSIGLASCLHETPLPVVIDISAKSVAENNTAPMAVKLTNTTKGADFYEWTFEGGEPATSAEKTPSKVTFKEPGEHKITLKAWNIATENSQTITVCVDSIVAADFDCPIIINDFAPVQVQIRNKTVGATSYQWTFSGGTPETSTDQHPAIVTFENQGQHHITLTTTNGSQSFSTQRTITVKPPLKADFQIEIAPKDEDMETPLTATVTNASTSCVNTLWSCDEATIVDKNKSQTQLLFNTPGAYIITLTADNVKQSKTVQKQIIVKENSGIRIFKNVELGIVQAKNSIGCFFSADLKRVLKSNEISTENRAAIDFGFYALNSNFEYCYFFSPNMAAQSTFAQIPDAITTFIDNKPISNITPAEFNAITTHYLLDKYTYPIAHSADRFKLDKLPQFFTLKTDDQRRGVIYIKDVITQNDESFIVADIIIEKRTHE